MDGRIELTADESPGWTTFTLVLPAAAPFSRENDAAPSVSRFHVKIGRGLG